MYSIVLYTVILHMTVYAKSNVLTQASEPQRLFRWCPTLDSCNA